MHGGDGTDWLVGVFVNSAAGVRSLGQDVDGTIGSGATMLRYYSIEQRVMFGSGFDDTFAGGSGADRYSSQTSNDRMFAGDGEDVLYGDDGDDRVFGDDGRDTLFGGPGDGTDTLYGGAGNDELFAAGGVGSATLYGDEADDWLYGGGPDLSVNSFRSWEPAWGPTPSTTSRTATT